MRRLCVGRVTLWGPAWVRHTRLGAHSMTRNDRGTGMTPRTARPVQAFGAAVAAIAVAAASCASTADPAQSQAPTTAPVVAAATTTTTTPAPIEMPDLVGWPSSYATLLLAEAGLTGPISEIDPDTGEDLAGTVTAQDPTAGTLIADADTPVVLHTRPTIDRSSDDEAEQSDTDTDTATDGDGDVEDGTTPDPSSDDVDPILAAAATEGWMDANGAVQAGAAGLMWVPWRDFDADADPQLIAQRHRWDATMPPLPGSVKKRIERGDPIARPKADKAGAWHHVVDKTDLAVHYFEHGSNVSEEIQVCPNRLGKATAATRRRETEMLSPGGLRIHSVGWGHSRLSFLLAWSPGEPMSTAGTRFLADAGFVPGDWSAEALEVLVRQAAIGAVVEELVPRAAMSIAPESLWEACMDAASTSLTSTRRAGTWGITLQSLWSIGLRLEHEAPPPERAWIEMLDAEARAMAIVCRPAETLHLLDASTGQRVGVLRQQPETIVAMSLTWTGDRFRLAHWHLEPGRCEPGSEAWTVAVAQLGAWADEDAAEVDIAARWAEGVRQPWLRVGRWVEVPQAIAWEAHRDAGLLARLWCAAGPPALHPLEAGQLRPEIESHCTAAQKRAMLAQAAAAPALTSAMSVFGFPADTAWAGRGGFARRTTAEILGCDPTVDEIAADQSARPIEPTLKRPWPPGLLPGSPGDGWPSPAVPCPGVVWPAFGDERFWWPESVAPFGGHGQRGGLEVE